MHAGRGTRRTHDGQQQAHQVDRLADEVFRHHLAWSPLYASQIGFEEYAGDLPDLSVAGEQRRQGELERFRTEAATIPVDGLDEERRITLQVLRRKVSDALLAIRARALEYTVTPIPQTGVAARVLISLPHSPVGTKAEAEGYLERCTKVPGWLETAAERLEEGGRAGRFPAARLLSNAVGQLHAYLASSAEDDPLLSLAGPVDDATTDGRERLEAIVADEVRPALARYREQLLGLRETARPDDRPGLAWLPDGAALYQQLAAEHTTTDHSVEDLHALGLELVGSLTEEMRSRGAETLGTSDFATITQRLRTDPDLFFRTPDEVMAAARDALARAQEALPRWLGTVPRVGCDVVPMGPHEVENGDLGHYQWPALDGSRPGTYWLNTYQPQTRPRFEAQTLAFHESVPGHHTQIALLYELPGLCDFRRHAHVTAFTEGWALYTERLADEMGLYTSDVSRLGMVSFDFWRACRLVVDTGLHAQGWSRDQAVDFMFEHSALTRKNVENEVDRYIGWPGQALGYMVGRLEIRRLRDEAEARLGAAFDIRAFHDTLLGHGNLPLSVLADVVADWIAQRARDNC